MRSQRNRQQSKNLCRNRLISQRNNNFIEKKRQRTNFLRTSSIVEGINSIVGKTSYVGLATLSLVLVNPIISSPVSASEEPEAGGEMSEEGTIDDTNTDITPLASTTSTVNISFSPTSANEIGRAHV